MATEEIRQKRAEIGVRIRQARNERGMAQTELAQRAGFARGVPISRMERGDYDADVVKHLPKFAAILGCSAEWLENGGAYEPENTTTHNEIAFTPYTRKEKDPEKQAEIGVRIRQARNYRGMSQTRLAQRAGFAQGVPISSMERGNYGGDVIKHLPKFAEILDCSAEWLENGDAHEPVNAPINNEIALAASDDEPKKRTKK